MCLDWIIVLKNKNTPHLLLKYTGSGIKVKVERRVLRSFSKVKFDKNIIWESQHSWIYIDQWLTANLLPLWPEWMVNQNHNARSKPLITNLAVFIWPWGWYFDQFTVALTKSNLLYIHTKSLYVVTCIQTNSVVTIVFVLVDGTTEDDELAIETFWTNTM